MKILLCILYHEALHAVHLGITYDFAGVVCAYLEFSGDLPKAFKQVSPQHGSDIHFATCENDGTSPDACILVRSISKNPILDFLQRLPLGLYRSRPLPNWA